MVSIVAFDHALDSFFKVIAAFIEFLMLKLSLSVASDLRCGVGLFLSSGNGHSFVCGDYSLEMCLSLDDTCGSRTAPLGKLVSPHADLHG